ncbi:Modification methylase PaeR7I [bioreactor metagenome]|uniref:site-specific DNA-methyltransferase (adenine-specific) n=1 Tax=bioreactor metagenome TaxID=1076179 RepID=A0A644WAE8_9ZZZZ|nr:N-6 DNA methylase [Desulfitobacterium hafniense]MEA5025891.1 N-6 DNA methylase [Desulfitobacterium hafniense]
MGSVIDNPKTKAKCQTFTSEKIVKEMLDYLDYTKDLHGKSVLENSCGNGQFLIEIVRRYIEDCNRKQFEKSMIKKGLEYDIMGIELDKEQYDACIKNLDKVSNKYGIKNVKWNIKRGDALRTTFDRQFDYVIGNPPYVSYWDLDESEREFIRNKFKACQAGACDYCYAFLQEGITSLNDRGKLAYIIPNSLFKTKSGKNIREILKPLITEVYDYTTNKAFETVLTASAIIVVDNAANSADIKYCNLAEKASTFTIKKNSLDNNSWLFIDSTKPKVATNYRFGDYFKVSTGVATQYNKAFVLNGWTEEENTIQKNGINIERGAVRKAASPKNKLREPVDYIIFPYYYENDGTFGRYSEEEFMTQFPNAYIYLTGYKEKLLKRNSEDKAAWYEYGRSQALSHIQQRKLLISSVITGKVHIYELDPDEVPFSGMYIVPLQDLTLDRAKQVLQSKEFLEYIKIAGINVNGKSLRITARDICEYQW